MAAERPSACAGRECEATGGRRAPRGRAAAHLVLGRAQLRLLQDPHDLGLRRRHLAALAIPRPRAATTLRRVKLQQPGAGSWHAGGAERDCGGMAWDQGAACSGAVAPSCCCVASLLPPPLRATSPGAHICCRPGQRQHRHRGSYAHMRHVQHVHNVNIRSLCLAARAAIKARAGDPVAPPTLDSTPDSTEDPLRLFQRPLEAPHKSLISRAPLLCATACTAGVHTHAPCGPLRPYAPAQPGRAP